MNKLMKYLVPIALTIGLLVVVGLLVSPLSDSFDNMGEIYIITLLAALPAFIEIVYIFCNAPKFGMSRLWALIPVFNVLLGLLFCIFMRSKSTGKGLVKTSKRTCPICGGKHSEDVTFCTICGNKLP